MKCIGIDFIIVSRQNLANSPFMKNLFYFVVCNLLLIVVVIMSSCSGREEMTHELSLRSVADTAHVTVFENDPCPYNCTSEHCPYRLHMEPQTKIRFSSKDSMVSKSELSRRSQKDLIRWSSLGGM